MKKFKLVLWVAFVLYLVLSVLIGMNDEKLIKEGFYFLWKKGIYTFYVNMKTWGLIGLVIVCLQFISDNLQLLSLNRKVKARDAEIIQLKAQLFDRQGSVKKDAPTITTSGQPEEAKPPSDFSQ